MSLLLNLISSASDVSENTMNVEKELRSKVSHEMNTVDKLAPEAKVASPLLFPSRIPLPSQMLCPDIVF